MINCACGTKLDTRDFGGKSSDRDATQIICWRCGGKWFECNKLLVSLGAFGSAKAAADSGFPEVPDGCVWEVRMNIPRLHVGKFLLTRGTTAPVVAYNQVSSAVVPLPAVANLYNGKTLLITRDGKSIFISEDVGYWEIPLHFFDERIRE